MHVLMAAAGGRGDVAPFTGLAAAIRAAGHSVTIASNDEYESLVVGCGLEFLPLPGTHGMFDVPRWVRVAGGPASAVGLIRLVPEHIRTLHKAVLAVARQDAPDVLALTGITTLGGYRVAQGLGLHGMDLLLQPGHTTADFPPSFVGGRSFGRLGNRVVGTAANAALEAMAGPARELRHELGLPRRGLRDGLLGQPDARRWPVFYGFSPAVVTRPADWPSGCEVTGYWWPQRPAAWSPPTELEAFLDSGPPPVFFGFGDMTPENTSELIDLAAEAGRQAGVRQVIQAGQTGILAISPVTGRRLPAGDSIVIGDVPHDWLFPRMAAVVHHAGAGTAAAGLRAGVPAVTVPVLADQPFWATRLAALGAGSPPIPHKQLSLAKLAPAIRDAVTRPSYRTRAEALSRRMASEDGAAPVIKMLARLSADRSAG
jgi:UDP:flavonoid glycosyltransferase YjiC (YdhE family)